ncbi:MAG: hypothetical protein ACRC11_06740, partial [Xenococcaceae cyanobacterium]
MSLIFPVDTFVVEDIKARTWKNGSTLSTRFSRRNSSRSKKWNLSFSPLQVGKQWFYSELEKVGELIRKEGIETKQLRDNLGLKKSKNKLAETFEAHCVDS